MKATRILIPLLLATLALATTACDNTISPLADDAESIFSIHGILDARTDSQLVRIGSLRATVLSDMPDIRDVEVRTREMGSGEIFSWMGIDEPDTSTTVGRLYAARFRPRVDTEYVLEVMREGKVLARARTRLPSDPLIVPAMPAGDTLQYTQSVVIDGIRNSPVNIQMKYDVVLPAPGDTESVLVEYAQAGERVGGGWRFFVFLKRDQLTVYRSLDAEESPPLGLISLGAVVDVRSKEFDDPEDRSNLENAHGFFGSISRHELRWLLDAASVNKIGYQDQQAPL